MNYPSRTKEELIEANFLLRQRIKQLEESETSPKRDERGSGTSDTPYHIFFDLAPDPMAITNFDNGQLIDVNQAFVAWSHYSRDKLIGHTTTELGFWADNKSRNAVLGGLYNKNTFSDVEVEFNRGNGESRQISFSGKVIEIENNRWLLSVARDITDRKWMGEALQESEERFRAIANHTHGWENWTGPDGGLVWVNPAVLDFTGYSVKECLDMSDFPLPLIHEADRARMRRFVSEAIQGKTAGNDEEFRVCCKDGRAKWASVSWQRIYNDKGDYVGQRSSVRDITDRKRAEVGLKKSQETLRSLINASDDSLLLTDINGMILIANEVLAQRLGKSIRDLIGTCQYDYFPPDVAQRRRKQYDMVVSTGKPVHFEDERANSFFEISAYPVLDEEGKTSKIAIFAQDTTKHKRTQEERENLIAELKDALSKIRTLSGFLPICSSCKKIRNEKGDWEEIEVHIRDNSDAEFSHGICPECADKLYPEYFKRE